MTGEEVADLRARVRRLEEVEAARGILHAYARAVDEPAPERVTALFRPDAVLTTPHGIARGHDEIRAFFAAAFARDPSLKRHFIINPLAVWTAPGLVRIRSSFLYTGRGEDRSVIGWGSYDDLVDVSGPEPAFAEKSIDLQVGTDLAAGWPLEP